MTKQTRGHITLLLIVSAILLFGLGVKVGAML
jgi:hypothetical protein